MVKRILFYSDYIAQILAVQTITLTVGHPVVANLLLWIHLSVNLAAFRREIEHQQCAQIALLDGRNSQQQGANQGYSIR